MAEFKKIPIYCPKCGARVLYWNGITKIQVATQCKSCGCYVKFDPVENKITKLKGVPERASAAGMRFY